MVFIMCICFVCFNLDFVSFDVSLDGSIDERFLVFVVVVLLGDFFGNGYGCC